MKPGSFEPGVLILQVSRPCRITTSNRIQCSCGEAGPAQNNTHITLLYMTGPIWGGWTGGWRWWGGGRRKGEGPARGSRRLRWEMIPRGESESELGYWTWLRCWINHRWTGGCWGGSLLLLRTRWASARLQDIELQPGLFHYSVWGWWILPVSRERPQPGTGGSDLTETSWRNAAAFVSRKETNV